MVVFGAGFGMVTQILVVAIQNAVEPREIGTATAAANLFRALGGSVGVAVFGAIFSRGASPLAADRPAWPRPARDHRHGHPGHPGRIHALAPAVQHGIANAVGSSLSDVFLVAAPIALLGCLIVLLLREQPLRGRDQVQPQPVAESDATAPRNRIAA